MFGTLLLGVFQSFGFLGGKHPSIAYQANLLGASTASVLIFLIFIVVLIGTLSLLVSRRRSKIAMWVLIGLFTLGLVSALAAHITIGTVDIINLAFLIIQALAVGLLFSPSARRRMRREDEKNEKLLEVFH
jgi:hypothetical protein